MHALLYFLMSAIAVDLLGYWLHRLAHRPWSPMYRPHMTHHVTNYPPRAFLSPKYLTSGGDGLAIWFAPFGALYVILALVLAVPHFWAIALGGLAVASLSSVVHDMSHVRGSLVWRTPAFRWAARHHRTHHSRMGRNFGILFSLWDRVFGTNVPVLSARSKPPAPPPALPRTS